MTSRTNNTVRTRYTRSSTVSVTQLFTDSCNSLIQKITSRVRGPSAASDFDFHSHPILAAVTAPAIISAASALPIEDETPRCLKSSAPREETDRRRAQRSLGRKSTGRRRVEDEAASKWKTSCVTSPVSSPKEERRPLRRREIAGAAEQQVSTRRKSTTILRNKCEENNGPALSKSATTVVLAEKAYPFVSTVPTSREKTPFRRRKSGGGHSELRPVVLDIPTDDEPNSERAAKRKEIQSLIMKYCNLKEDEKKSSQDQPTTALSKCQQKYSGILNNSHHHQTVSLVLLKMPQSE